jgi:hypothetical protein
LPHVSRHDDGARPLDASAVSCFALPFSFGAPFRRYICRSVIKQTDGEEEKSEIFEKSQEDDHKAEGRQEGGHTIRGFPSHSADFC